MVFLWFSYGLLIILIALPTVSTVHWDRLGSSHCCLDPEVSKRITRRSVERIRERSIHLCIYLYIFGPLRRSRAMACYRCEFIYIYNIVYIYTYAYIYIHMFGIQRLICHPTHPLQQRSHWVNESTRPTSKTTQEWSVRTEGLLEESMPQAMDAMDAAGTGV